MDAPDPGGLGGTFGGNPVACAAALAVLDEVATDDFRAHAEELGSHIRTKLDDLASRIDHIGDVRGIGSMLAHRARHRPRHRKSLRQTSRGARPRPHGSAG